MRKLIACLAIATLFTIGPTWNAPAEAQGRNHYCRFQRADGRWGWSDYDVKVTIRCAARKYGVSLDTALYIANRESNFDERALNRYSGCAGIYQHVQSYWAGRRATFLNLHPYWKLAPSVFNPRSNVLVSIDMVRRGGWGPWS